MRNIHKLFLISSKVGLQFIKVWYHWKACLRNRKYLNIFKNPTYGTFCCDLPTGECNPSRNWWTHGPLSTLILCNNRQYDNMKATIYAIFWVRGCCIYQATNERIVCKNYMGHGVMMWDWVCMLLCIFSWVVRGLL